MATKPWTPGTVIDSAWLNDVDAIVYEGKRDDGTLGSEIDLYTSDIPLGAFRTVSEKLKESVSAYDAGAIGDGVTDDTAALKRLFDYCIPNKVTAVLKGTYKVSGLICTNGLLSSGGLYIECDGDVTINMTGTALAGSSMLMCYTSTPCSASISGGRLILNLDNKMANGIYIRHDAATDGGTVNFGPVTITNAKETNASSTTENQGILVYGRFVDVNIKSPIIKDVDRTNTSGGACKGISVSEIVGQVTIESPTVERVKCTGGSADADGISIFGLQLNGVYGWRAGTAQIYDPVFKDCQGRSFKAQVSEASLYRPRVFRKDVVSISTADIDFQVGNGLVLEPFFEYRLNGTTSPLHPGFFPISIQQQSTDRPNRAIVKGGALRSEVAVPRVVYLTVGANALDGEVCFDGLSLLPLGSLSTSLVSRAFLEFNAAQVAASVGKTHIEIKNNRGNMSGYPLVGYTDYGSSVASKLSFDIKGNTNTGPLAANSRVFAAVSGSAIPQVLSFALSDNVGFVDLFTSWTFSMANIPVGTRFTIDIGSCTVTNPPGWGTSGVALVEGLSMYSNTSRSVRVTKDHANTTNTVFYTGNGGTTWGTIK